MTYIITIYAPICDRLEIESFEVDGLEQLLDAVNNIVHVYETKWDTPIEVVSVVRGTVR